jgi:hypothetical protein
MTNDTPERAPAMPTLLLAVGAAVLAVVLRVYPLAFGFWMVGALALFCGARLRLWQALALPLAVMIASDFLIYAVKGWTPFNPVVYGSLLVYVGLGWLLAGSRSSGKIAAFCVAGSLQFFLVTNFAVWAGSSVDPAQVPAGQGYFLQEEGSPYGVPLVRYARNLHGLMTCYALAVPFHHPDYPPFYFAGPFFFSDLFFCGVLFGAHALLARRQVPQPVPVRS